MKYSIVYSSRTGNTALLAEKLADALPAEERVYLGVPDPRGEAAELIFTGFWTDRGGADQESAAFLERLHNKKIFLFGTAGFGGSQAYFDQILGRVAARLDPSNTLAGSFLCQGRMPPSVRQRYEAMAVRQPEQAREWIENFDRALTHPNEEDLKRLGELALNVMS